MNKDKRFHILQYQKYIKYALLLCVLPMIRAVLMFDWESLMFALTQDIAILAACFIITIIAFIKGQYSYTPRLLTIKKGILLSKTLFIPLKDIAVVETVRPLTFRLLYASKVTVYFSSKSTLKKITFVVSKKNAEEFCTAIMPVKSDVAVFEPSGADRLTFVMLSVNLVTSSIFGIMTAKNVADIMGKEVQKFALDSFTKFELLFEKVLPTGLAFFTAVLFLVLAAALISSIIRTAFFKVCRNGGILITKGGIFSKFERRFCCSEIIMCDVRTTPAARLLQRYPVFLSAGSYHGSDTPVFAFSKKQRHRLQMLLPEFELGTAKYSIPYKRNIFQFVWQQLTALLIIIAVGVLSYFYLPDALPLLIVPLILILISLANAIDGFGRENLYRQDNRTIFAVFTRFFTLHEVCIFTTDIALCTWRTPFYLFDGRSDIYLQLPYRRRLRIRGVQISYANNFKLIM